MLLDQKVCVQTLENANYADHGEKSYKRSSAWCKGVSSNFDLIGRLGAMQSNMHSHMMVELSAVESSM